MATGAVLKTAESNGLVGSIPTVSAKHSLSGNGIDICAAAFQADEARELRVFRSKFARMSIRRGRHEGLKLRENV